MIRRFPDVFHASFKKKTQIGLKNKKMSVK